MIIVSGLGKVNIAFLMGWWILIPGQAGGEGEEGGRGGSKVGDQAGKGEYFFL